MAIRACTASRQTEIYPLAWFRIVFGTMLVFSTLRFVALGWVDEHYIQGIVRFSYFGFDWLPYPSPSVTYALHGLLVVSSACFLIGYRYRLAALLQFLCFTYLELLDASYYLNHYYFVSLMSGLMIFLPAHRCLSLDVRIGRTAYVDTVPNWAVSSVKLLIAIVYIYAGLAKINSDWLLHALPLRIWLPAHGDLPILGSLFQYELTAYLFSWMGMLFDTFIIFFLLNNRTRIWAFFAAVFFHGVTGLLFQIGVFPLVMVGAITIFFSSDRIKTWLVALARFELRWLGSDINLNHLIVNARTPFQLTQVQHTLACTGLVLFFAIQLLFPWRYLLYPTSLFWTEDGYRFSWRVMLMEKAGYATFYLHFDDGRKRRVRNELHLNPHQVKQVAFQPDFILQYADYLADAYSSQARRVVAVTVDSWVTLNGRPSSRYVSPDVNLLDIEDNWAPRTWLEPPPGTRAMD